MILRTGITRSQATLGNPWLDALRPEYVYGITQTTTQSVFTRIPKQSLGTREALHNHRQKCYKIDTKKHCEPTDSGISETHNEMDIQKSLELWATCELARSTALKNGVSEEEAHELAHKEWQKWSHYALKELKTNVLGPDFYEMISNQSTPRWISLLGIRLRIENDSGPELAKEFFEKTDKPLQNWEKLFGLTFSNHRFDDKCDFSNFSFPSGVSFQECEFLKGVRFSKCNFLGWAKFDDCTFHGSVSFSRCEFVDNATFHRASFKGGAEFGAEML